MIRGESDSVLQCNQYAESFVFSSEGDHEMSKAALWLRNELEKTIIFDIEHGYVSEEEMKKRFGR